MTLEGGEERARGAIIQGRRNSSSNNSAGYNPDLRLESALSVHTFWDLVLLKAKREFDLGRGSNVVAALLDGLLQILVLAGYLAKETLVKKKESERTRQQQQKCGLEIVVDFTLR